MPSERVTRGRMSRIDALDPELKDELNQLLRSGVTQKEILERLRGPLEARGEKPLSAAGLNRYATRMESVTQRIRESREIAAAYVAKLGEEPTGDVGQLTIEILRTMAFDSAAQPRVDEEGNPVPFDAEMIGDLALAVSRLERAADISRAREAKMRAAIADKAEKEMRAEGLSGDTVARIRQALEANA
ncbi:MAG: DUF3486 family protein [Holophagales bacterium]|nr:DUF3486 family protein [Holophagales bacterium]MYC11920.1 DUF3486 family protein [Holophagales bacterium]